MEKKMLLVFVSREFMISKKDIAAFPHLCSVKERLRLDMTQTRAGISDDFFLSCLSFVVLNDESSIFYPAEQDPSQGSVSL
jgi:hypothetical protein